MNNRLDELEVPKKDTTYFAFRVPTDQHHKLRSVLAQRGISGQKFFTSVVEDLLKSVEAEETIQ